MSYHRYDYNSRNRKETVMTVALIAFMVILIVSSMARGVFAKEAVAIRTLQAQGFSNIKIVDHAWFFIGLRGCDGHDAARFTAKATNPAGIQTQVYVCTGAFFKGGTIRVK